MTSPITFELFAASPGDVPKERAAALRVIKEIQRTIGPVLEINIRSFFWEHDLGPGVHVDGPQGLVDAHSNLTKCDILVGIFNDRLGTETSDGKTGTQHEVMVAYDRWQKTKTTPQIMLYFGTKGAEKTAESLKQATLLTAFRDSLPKNLFHWEYDSAQHFERLFREHLTRHVLQVWNARGRPADALQFANSDLKLGLVSSATDLIQTNASIVSEAEKFFFSTGSRARDEKYLKAIEARIKEVPSLVVHRVLMGPPFRSMLKDHLRNLVQLRPPDDRSLGFKTMYIGLFDNLQQQSEVFIAGNEKRALVVLPSRAALGQYNTALVVDDKEHVNDLYAFVKQMYAASHPIETIAAIDALPTVLG